MRIVDVILEFVISSVSWFLTLNMMDFFKWVFEKPSVLCIDQLRDELLCPICLEICLRPSTTPCGHSFCRKCLRSAIKCCGRKCPKCMLSISDGRGLTVNTVLWNTIQLIFPKEIEARKVFLQAARNQTKAKNLGTRDQQR